MNTFLYQVKHHLYHEAVPIYPCLPATHTLCKVVASGLLEVLYVLRQTAYHNDS